MKNTLRELQKKALLIEENAPKKQETQEGYITILGAKNIENLTNYPTLISNISNIKETFINSVATMYHSRIIYPDSKVNNSSQNVNDNQQPSIPNI